MPATRSSPRPQGLQICPVPSVCCARGAGCLLPTKIAPAFSRRARGTGPGLWPPCLKERRAQNPKPLGLWGEDARRKPRTPVGAGPIARPGARWGGRSGTARTAPPPIHGEPRRAKAPDGAACAVGTISLQRGRSVAGPAGAALRLISPRAGTSRPRPPRSGTGEEPSARARFAFPCRESRGRDG